MTRLNRGFVCCLPLCASVGLFIGCGDLQSFGEPDETSEAPVEELGLVPRQTVAPAAAQGEAPAAARQEPVPAFAVYLSAGVGLPQTLPNGTAVGFSVDYQFRSGGPEVGTQYVWVIQRKEGDPNIAAVQLSGKGTLQKFLPWRPEQGPFESYVAVVGEDGSQRAISKRVAMR